MAPTRYVWQYDTYMAHENVPAWLRRVIRPFALSLKGWDYRAAQRVDHFLCNSTETQTRIRRFYDHESTVIYPPVDVAERFQPTNTRDDYFLSVGRLVPYKRIDLLVEACTRLDLPLKVAGKGRDLERLQAMAGPTVEFLGFVPDEELPELFARARAFVFPGLEDFGITPVQAQAAGRPVIAFGQGGALDSVIPGKTGVFFEEQTVESLVQTLQDFDAAAYKSEDCRQNALRFDVSVFRRKLDDYVTQAWDIFQQQLSQG
jgi:glycosyltransferase involved in cell wall biosynthesis